MTPTETAATLRRYNEWRLGDEYLPQPDTKQITAAIYAAVEMIDRLEAAESEAIEQARLNGMGSEREAALMAKLKVAEKERDAAELMSLALRAKVEAMERQRPEPAARIVGEIGEWVSNGEGTYSLGGRLDAFVPLRNWTLLYALPGAQPTPSVPEGWQLVPTAESRHPGIYKMLSALHAADNTPGASEWESYRAMLSEAPEAKP